MRETLRPFRRFAQECDKEFPSAEDSAQGLHSLGGCILIAWEISRQLWEGANEGTNGGCMRARRVCPIDGTLRDPETVE